MHNIPLCVVQFYVLLIFKIYYMILDTNDYSAQELSMFFEELSKQLKTKQQYFETNNITRKGVDKRLKSIYAPQTYKLCGITLIEDAVVPKVEVEKLVLIKPIKYF